MRKPEGNNSLREFVRRWEDNIRSKMVLREIGWGGMDWTVLAQDRDQWRALVDTAMNLRVPLNLGKFLRATQLMVSQEVLSSMELFSYIQLIPNIIIANLLSSFYSIHSAKDKLLHLFH
jgi:hypothetical protein